MTAMDLTIHTSFLPHDDPETALAFWRDTLGFQVRNDVGHGKMRWLTVGPPTSPAPPSSWGRRPPTPASPTRSAA
jgi:catechol 2,3-dioxygenase-like lactoylglutathione lyase family enzyme